MRRVLLSVVVALLGVGALLGVWSYQALNQKKAIDAIEVNIAAGTSTHKIATQLQRQGVISSQLLFRLWSRWTKTSNQLQAGYYRFEGLMSMLDVMEQMQQGQVLQLQVTVAEGLRTPEVLQHLAQSTATPLPQWQEAWQSLSDPLRFENLPVEGVLLPETYTYTLPVDPKKILQQMMQAQRALLQTITVETDWNRLRILASIIEKETALDEERPLVSAVIRNRMALGMRLQMDPTVIYGMVMRDGAFSGNITREDLKRDTPWNSYTRQGIPPSPICNPGQASLRAAANPADATVLYFVANGEGGHWFSDSLAAHQQRVRQWINIERQR
ncbi:MAG: endolytic transglycosylase MltG [Zetaproteobacteria bacterium]|nr:endolytic transglycosylase MltG [Zetaproteobacteria bacterium]